MLIIRNHEVVLESLEYIESHLGEKILVGDIAGKFGYSEYYFSRMFSKYIGISVMEYVKRRRLISAAKEIMHGMKVIDAALKYSYDSHSGFTKAFKKEYGYTPSLLSAMKMQIDDLTGGSYMSELFIKQTDEQEDKDKLFAALLNRISCNQNDANLVNICKAYEFSKKAYEGIRRYSGDEYITHPLNVAIILADIGAGENAIIAGLMCDILEKTNVSRKELESNLTEKIVNIIVGVSDFDILCEFENDDIVLVKLADRLHNMRTLRFMNEDKWKCKAKETIEIYLPLAKKLGNNVLTDELNNLAVEYA